MLNDDNETPDHPSAVARALAEKAAELFASSPRHVDVATLSQTFALVAIAEALENR